MITVWPDVAKGDETMAKLSPVNIDQLRVDLAEAQFVANPSLTNADQLRRARQLQAANWIAPETKQQTSSRVSRELDRWIGV